MSGLLNMKTCPFDQSPLITAEGMFGLSELHQPGLLAPAPDVAGRQRLAATGKVLTVRARSCPTCGFVALFDSDRY